MTDRILAVCRVWVWRPGFLITAGIHLVLMVLTCLFLVADPATKPRFPIFSVMPQSYGLELLERPPEYAPEIQGMLDEQLYQTVIQKSSALAPMMFSGANISRTTIERIAAVPSATNLRFFSCRFRKDALEALSKLTNVTALGLQNCQLEPDELQYVASIPRLEMLDLRGNNITGGLKHLAAARELRGLLLSDLPASETDDLQALGQINTLYAPLQTAGSLDESQLQSIGNLSGLRLLYVTNLSSPGEATDTVISTIRRRLPGVVVRSSVINVRRVALIMAVLVLATAIQVNLATQRLTFFSRAESILLPNGVSPHLIPAVGMLVFYSGVHTMLLICGQCDPAASVAISIGYIGLLQFADAVSYSGLNEKMGWIVGLIVGLASMSWWFLVFSFTGSSFLDDLATGQRPIVAGILAITGVVGIVSWNLTASSLVRRLGELGFTEAFVSLTEQHRWMASRQKNIGSLPLWNAVVKWIRPVESQLARKSDGELPPASARCRLLRASTPQFEWPIYRLAIGVAALAMMVTLGLVFSGYSNLSVSMPGLFQVRLLEVALISSIIITAMLLTYTPLMTLGKWVDRRRYLAGDLLRPLTRQTLEKDVRQAVARDLAEFAGTALITTGLLLVALTGRDDFRSLNVLQTVELFRCGLVTVYVASLLWLGHSVVVLGMAVRSQWRCYVLVAALGVGAIFIPLALLMNIEAMIMSNISFETTFVVLLVLMCTMSVLISNQASRVWKNAEFVD